jgi:EAL domain-containing protein (putative c-di-GMP-specific phosphodiesterase class I)
MPLSSRPLSSPALSIIPASGRPSARERLAALLGLLVADGGRTTAALGGLRLDSHFQPIYSLSHARVVGHEALLRASDASGQPVPPPQVFDGCRDERELARCDSLSRLVHLANFGAQASDGQWLFLNVHPRTFERLALTQGADYLQAVSERFGLPGHRLVLEVLETATDGPDFPAAMALARAHGCLIAIDDFGAGHSNFDRVWRLQPDIVKLDRSLTMRAAHDARAGRVVAQMASLLHECGALVLMEGVEDEAAALLAMEADVDLVQGWYFGRPQAQIRPAGHAPQELTRLPRVFDALRQAQRSQHRDTIAPYLNAIGHAGVLLSAGRPMEEACGPFLALPRAQVCYRLDDAGYQVQHNLWACADHPAPHPGHEPLRDARGACWVRRPYFRRAMEAPQKVQVTRPYRSLHGSRLCTTVSMAYRAPAIDGQPGRWQVICGDIDWDGEPGGTTG